MKARKIPQFLWTIPCVALLSACGGGGGDSTSSSATTSTITASVVKGPVDGASCELYSITSAGAVGDLLASGTSVAGSVSFSVSSANGNRLVQCTGGTYTDEATGTTMTAPRLRARVALSGNTPVAVTPLTELAVAVAPDLNNVDNSMVAEAFGLGATDITRVQPTDLNSDNAGSDEEGDYAQVLAMLSQYQADQGQTLTEVIEDLTEALDDGAFSEAEKTDLSEAATNLASSPVGGSLNAERLEALLTTLETVVDETPPVVTFSPSSLSLTVNQTGMVDLTVSDGVIDSVICNNEAVSFGEGMVSSTLAGSFQCTATAYDDNQLMGQATLSLTVSLANNPPVANAGEDVIGATGESVSFDGSASTDADQDELSYAWTLSTRPNGSAAVLTNANTVSPSLVTDVDGVYQLTLNVSDGIDSNSDTVSLTVATIVLPTNNAPVANAGEDVTAPTGARISFDGSSSADQDQDELSFAWTLSTRPNGSAAALTDANTATPSLVTDVDGVYQLTLNVSDGTDSDSDTVSLTVSTNTWLINNSTTGAYINALVNVQSVSSTSIGPNTFNRITATGIPDYEILMTQDDVDALNARPKAATDFISGVTSAQAGEVISFGQSVGYSINQVGCALGYWPPGPACPSNQSRQANIPATPAPASSTCATSINTMGLMLNGTAIFNWSDGVSYQNEGEWNQLAPEFEIYDVDMCSGHAQQQGNYHHHMFSKCLASLFSDDGQTHSPIYGYAADGYPLYGPYHAKNVLAKSAWVKRNYSEVNEGGCGDGTRSCLLLDQYDLTQGTVSTNYPGPATSAVVSSNSGNNFTVTSGYYFQDYYYDASLTAQGGEYLDDHNGHDHDGLGYHYHHTVVEQEGQLIPVFPYNIGPTFYGNTPGGSVFTCNPMP